MRLLEDTLRIDRFLSTHLRRITRRIFFSGRLRGDAGHRVRVAPKATAKRRH